MIKDLLGRDMPIFGICLGHQLLALALGAKTVKMGHGHHGANHPVRDVETGKVEITSMNHGFAVDSQSLPVGVIETHVSLFDGSNCGIAHSDKPVFFGTAPPRGFARSDGQPVPVQAVHRFDARAPRMMTNSSRATGFCRSRGIA